MRRPARLALATLLAAAPLAAQATGQTASRDELALSYLQLDYLLRDRQIPTAELAAFNRAFDASTLAFFAGQFDRTRTVLDSLSAVLEPSPVARRAAASEAAERLLELEATSLLLPVASGDPVPYHLVLSDREGPMPLVIALHGAGADERMFLAGYGAGRIARLAQEQGFAMVSPLTTGVAGRPERLEELVRAVEERVAVDRQRIYLVGHSMGAGAAWQLARARPELIAAVACIAGVCGAGAEGPPLLVVAAEVDPLAAPARLEATVTAAREAGQRVEYRLAAGWGHTLVVGDVLPEVIAWLLRHPVPLGGR
jgi:poly(3-hydroxybutyrate) depolymerase